MINSPTSTICRHDIEAHLHALLATAASFGRLAKEDSYSAGYIAGYQDAIKALAMTVGADAPKLPQEVNGR